MIGAGFADGLVSCIMVTQASRWKGEAPVGAVSLLAQSYKRWELVLVTADPCPAMLQFAAMVERATVVQLDGDRTMGQLRQAGVEMAAGDFVATWDDDDWSSAFRLQEQLDCVRLNPVVDACCLNRVTICDERNGREPYPSPRHCWDPTMVARRERMPEYEPERHTGEDGVLIGKFNRLVLLDKPDLYRYRIHGDSLCGHVMADEWFAWHQQNGGAL